MRAVVALDGPRAQELAAELELEGLVIVAVVAPSAVGAEHLSATDTIVLPGTRDVLSAELVADCDRAGVRIIALGGAESRLLARFGLTAQLAPDAPAWQIAAAIRTDTPAVALQGTLAPAERAHRTTVVWGPQGAPGRSILSIQLALELARRGRRTALIDADTVAPSLALLLGLGDDSPGIAAACRRAELGGLDSAELTRLAITLETSAGPLEVLPGINRPGRWPELSSSRLSGALRACRDWVEESVVDVSAAFDADDEATHDMVGPRRHAATAAALHAADRIIAVAAADPLGISRFLRDHAELRLLTAPTPISVVVNQVRPGPLGVDARGQIRRTLERFAGIVDVTFLPFDQRAADAALLHARPMADVTPRSAFVAAVRRLASALSPADDAATGGSSRGSSRGARRPRSARAARAASPVAGDRVSPS